MRNVKLVGFALLNLTIPYSANYLFLGDDLLRVFVVAIAVVLGLMLFAAEGSLALVGAFALLAFYAFHVVVSTRRMVATTRDDRAFSLRRLPVVLGVFIVVNALARLT